MRLYAGMLNNVTLKMLDEYSTLYNRAIEVENKKGLVQCKILPRYTRTGDIYE